MYKWQVFQAEWELTEKSRGRMDRVWGAHWGRVWGGDCAPFSEKFFEFSSKKCRVLCMFIAKKLYL